MLLNIGFGLTVVAALLLLAIAGGVAWYGDHLSAAATVNGQTITKDAFAKQLAVNAFRIDYQSRRIRTLLTAGQMRTADATARQNLLDQRTQQADAIALEQLIDGQVQAELAAKQGVTVTDADVDARLTEEATTPEMRHAWLIEVKPEIPAGASAASDAHEGGREGQGRCGAGGPQGRQGLGGGRQGGLHRRLQGPGRRPRLRGQELVAGRGVLRRHPGRRQGHAATEVIEGADGTYRIGRVTEIVAPVVDATLADQVKGAGISMDDFRAALRRDATRTEAERGHRRRRTSSPGRSARSPRSSWVRTSTRTAARDGQDRTGAVKVRHILYSPER